ncbi:hypothetical protein TNIN_17431 [Trichonephila inaurata madagascariensis]|uniref:Uncharacterized protein n=1 Tax=Trichonephila inaurata madagascariensis TaxID=2747483 RepID=A0A8X6IPZ5_9ARAC|nr:hypothetical protein TNIN_17431 [Trichonephila inaurata madagascariensis]
MLRTLIRKNYRRTLIRNRNETAIIDKVRIYKEINPKDTVYVNLIISVYRGGSINLNANGNQSNSESGIEALEIKARKDCRFADTVSSSDRLPRNERWRHLFSIRIFNPEPWMSWMVTRA